ncbi:selenocysteine lyase/cysteine desulfurase [Kibdelosporangium banguiense]|uniref:Selenocysteine lyase/cysteine desulfurase n=1 Tax=Kibdelosporangium banguiense TaxID=1365924 RepID=A0ABS4TYL9_9PSEU|nr:aminotransferase class V-fold PLP-dependent enzyme [Kibdelosporangium banguiense]MBP2329482.1 selenocysteine lyase/cysteine desulfurase [Kibdelosporangium banguiense]
MNKLVGILELRLPAALDARYHLRDRIPAAERPVVFVGPYEHHSNELPWRESIAEVVVIDEDADGHIDIAELQRELRRYADRPLRISSFSAASNVTGVPTDADRIAALLHEHGPLSFWDYAAAAPYVSIRMRESTPGRRDHKDAIFLSPHKFVGGPQTPGVLVIRRNWSPTPCPRLRAVARSRSSSHSDTAISTIPLPARKAGLPRSSSPSAPGCVRREGRRRYRDHPGP